MHESESTAICTVKIRFSSGLRAMLLMNRQIFIPARQKCCALLLQIRAHSSTYYAQRERLMMANLLRHANTNNNNSARYALRSTGRRNFCCLPSSSSINERHLTQTVVIVWLEIKSEACVINDCMFANISTAVEVSWYSGQCVGLWKLDALRKCLQLIAQHGCFLTLTTVSQYALLEHDEMHFLPLHHCANSAKCNNYTSSSTLFTTKIENRTGKLAKSGLCL